MNTTREIIKDYELHGSSMNQKWFSEDEMREFLKGLKKVIHKDDLDKFIKELENKLGVDE